MRHGSHDHPVRPKGAGRPSSRLRAARSPVYISSPTSARLEASLWLKPIKRS